MHESGDSSSNSGEEQSGTKRVVQSCTKRTVLHGTCSVQAQWRWRPTGYVSKLLIESPFDQSTHQHGGSSSDQQKYLRYTNSVLFRTSTGEWEFEWLWNLSLDRDPRHRSSKLFFTACATLGDNSCRNILSQVQVTRQIRKLDHHPPHAHAAQRSCCRRGEVSRHRALHMHTELEWGCLASSTNRRHIAHDDAPTRSPLIIDDESRKRNFVICSPTAHAQMAIAFLPTPLNECTQFWLFLDKVAVLVGETAQVRSSVGRAEIFTGRRRDLLVVNFCDRGKLCASTLHRLERRLLGACADPPYLLGTEHLWCCYSAKQGEQLTIPFWWLWCRFAAQWVVNSISCGRRLRPWKIKYG